MYEFDPIETADEKDVKKERKVVKEGKNYFIVENAEICTSKAGNEQLKVTLRVNDEHGTSNPMWDYFPFLSDTFSEKVKKIILERLKNLLTGCGKSFLYYKGRFNEHELIGCSGTCYVKHETSDEFGLQPKIKYYYDKPDGESSEPHHLQQANKAAQPDDLDDIPF